MMHINEIRFMTSTSHPMHHCGCEHFANNAKESFHNALDKMPRVHNEGGHRIKTIDCDQEFQSVMEDDSDDS